MSILEIISKAIEFDENGLKLQALKLYREGITQLEFKWNVETDGGTKRMLRQKIIEYKDRAKRVNSEIEMKIAKEIHDQIRVLDGSTSNDAGFGKYKNIPNEIEMKTSKGEIHDQILIRDGSKGYSYDTVFGKYLDSTIIEVTIEEPYLKINYQFHNLVTFCELLVLKCANLKFIRVITTSASQNDQQQLTNNDLRQLNPSLQLKVQQRQSVFQTLLNSLQDLGIAINYEINDKLHHRQVILSNGFVIKVCRGLHYFKPPLNYHCIGAFNQNFRECLETNIDVLFCPRNKM